MNKPVTSLAEPALPACSANSANRVFARAVLTICLVFSSCFTLAACYRLAKDDSLAMLAAVLVATCAFVALLLLFMKAARNLADKTLIRIVNALSVAALVIQLVIACNMKIVPDVDLSHIIEQYQLMEGSGSVVFSLRGYFGLYTNNIPLCILLYWLFTAAGALGFNDISLVGGVFNVCMLFVAYRSFFGIARLLSSDRAASYATTLLLLNPTYYAYASYYYTDTTSVGFLMLACYFFVRSRAAVNRKAAIAFGVASGLFFGVASSIRVTSSFLVIAILACIILRKQLRQAVTAVIASFIGILVAVSAVAFLTAIHVPYNTSDTAVPFTHFLMMGSNAKADGMWNGDDVAFTQSFPTHEEKINSTIDVWLSRLDEQGVLADLHLAVKKEVLVWTTWHKDYLNITKTVEDENLVYDLIRGDKSLPFQLYMRIYNVALLAAITGGLICARKRPSAMSVTLAIYWIIAIAFYLFWEAHWRHSLSFFMLLTALAIPLIEWLAVKLRSSERL